MKFSTLTILTLGSSLTSVLAAPTPIIDPTDALARQSHGDPYWCGAPFCGKEKRDAIAEPTPVEDREAKHHKHKDPYDCGAPFCDKEKREAEPEAVAEAKPPKGFPHPKCGSNGCQPYGKLPSVDKREAEPEAVADAKPPKGLPHPKCGHNACVFYGKPPGKRDAAPEAVAEAKPPRGFPHPKCGKNGCQPYGKPPGMTKRVFNNVKDFVKRQYSCGAPFCAETGVAKGVDKA